MRTDSFFPFTINCSEGFPSWHLTKSFVEEEARTVVLSERLVQFGKNVVCNQTMEETRG